MAAPLGPCPKVTWAPGTGPRPHSSQAGQRDAPHPPLRVFLPHVYGVLLRPHLRWGLAGRGRGSGRGGSRLGGGWVWHLVLGCSLALARFGIPGGALGVQGAHRGGAKVVVGLCAGRAQLLLSCREPGWPECGSHLGPVPQPSQTTVGAQSPSRGSLITPRFAFPTGQPCRGSSRP